MPTPPEKKVSVGLGSRIGVVLTILGGALTTAVAAGASLGLTTREAAILTTVSGSLTMLQRAYQAAKL